MLKSGSGCGAHRYMYRAAAEAQVRALMPSDRSGELTAYTRICMRLMHAVRLSSTQFPTDAHHSSSATLQAYRIYP